MQPASHFWAGRRVCVTGGTGFLGWHLVRRLRHLGAHVRIFGLPPSSSALEQQLRGSDCVFGDIRDPIAVRQALRDCQVVFHTAGTVSVWGPGLVQMRDIHVQGTRQVLQALPAHARMIHTSSVVAVGAARGEDLLTETSPFELTGLKVDYVHAKRTTEEVALAAASRGQDVVVVNPAFLIGPDDFEGSVMGRFCLRCWKGKVPLIPPGGFNFVDVRDVADGHLLAAERGDVGQRYILGGVNRSLVSFVQALAAVRGMSSRWRFRMPAWLYTLIACAAEQRARFVRREPYPSFQQVRVNRYYWYYASDRARAELGFEPRPLDATLADTHAWYCAMGHLKETMSGPGSPESRRAA